MHIREDLNETSALNTQDGIAVVAIFFAIANDGDALHDLENVFNVTIENGMNKLKKGAEAFGQYSEIIISLPKYDIYVNFGDVIRVNVSLSVAFKTVTFQCFIRNNNKIIA